MNGLDKILGRIKADAEAYADRVTSDADEQSEEIIAEAEDAARKAVANARKKAETDASAIIERAKSSSQLAERNALLAMKSELIDEAFALAVKKLASLPPERYLAFLTSQLDAAISDAPNASYTMSVRKADRGILQTLLKKYPGITLEARDSDIDGGFILHRGDIDSDCTLSAAVSELRDALTGEVAAVLFS